MVTGFCRCISKNIRDALNLEFFKSLQHVKYNYLKVLPQEYITNLDTNHCLLDVTKSRNWRRTTIECGNPIKPQAVTKATQQGTSQPTVQQCHHQQQWKIQSLPTQTIPQQHIQWQDSDQMEQQSNGRPNVRQRYHINREEKIWDGQGVPTHRQHKVSQEWFQ